MHVIGSALEPSGNAWPVGHKAPNLHKLLHRIHCWQLALGRKIYDVSPVRSGDGGREHDEGVRMFPRGGCECLLKFVGPLDL